MERSTFFLIFTLWSPVKTEGFAYYEGLGDKLNVYLDRVEYLHIIMVFVIKQILYYWHSGLQVYPWLIYHL